MSTMGEVIRSFEQFTGLEWYPEPQSVLNNSVFEQALGKVDGIIASQREAKGVSHGEAEKDLDATLCPDAERRFTVFKEWVSGRMSSSTVSS